MTTEKYAIPPIAPEWYQALTHQVRWHGSFPITLRYTFDTHVPESYLEKGKLWGAGYTVIPLSESVRDIMRAKFQLWEKVIGDYFRFIEIDSLAPTDFQGTVSSYSMKRSALNTVHIFHHGSTIHNAGTAMTYNVAENGMIRFALMGFATNALENPHLLNVNAAHEIGHLWLKHPMQFRSKDTGPFILPNQLSQNCTDTLMIYTRFCPPAESCRLAAQGSADHCALLLPQLPLLKDIQTIDAHYNPRYQTWRKQLALAPAADTNLHDELGNDILTGSSDDITIATAPTSSINTALTTMLIAAPLIGTMTFIDTTLRNKGHTTTATIITATTTISSIAYALYYNSSSVLATGCGQLAETLLEHSPYTAPFAPIISSAINIGCTWLLDSDDFTTAVAREAGRLAGSSIGYVTGKALAQFLTPPNPSWVEKSSPTPSPSEHSV